MCIHDTVKLASIILSIFNRKVLSAMLAYHNIGHWLSIICHIQEDPQTNLIAILIEFGDLFLCLWINGGVYTNKYVNILEGSFVLNLTTVITVSNSSEEISL